MTDHDDSRPRWPRPGPEELDLSGGLGNDDAEAGESLDPDLGGEYLDPALTGEASEPDLVGEATAVTRLPDLLVGVADDPDNPDDNAELADDADLADDAELADDADLADDDADLADDESGVAADESSVAQEAEAAAPFGAEAADAAEAAAAADVAEEVAASAYATYAEDAPGAAADARAGSGAEAGLTTEPAVPIVKLAAAAAATTAAAAEAAAPFGAEAGLETETAVPIYVPRPSGRAPAADPLQAAAAAEQAGDPASARAILREALAARPRDPGVTLALARLLASSGDVGEAEGFLRGVLLHLGEAPPEYRSELLYWLAAVRERAGDPAEANRLLADACRLRRDDLSIRLALGESCFRLRLWREAAVHLTALAAYPAAASHPADVARGLAHAAQAEAHLLRPAAAEKLAEQALRLDPSCAEALLGLGRLRLDRGEHAAAADLLLRAASVPLDAGDRGRLGEALGAVALRLLEDPDRAERCLIGAVRAATPCEARHVPLLEKLLDLQRRRPPDAARAQAAELLAFVHPDPVEAEARLDEAVDAYLAAGELTRARVAAVRHADARPADEAAVWRAARLELADGQLESAIHRLGRALDAWGARGDGAGASPRRAELWSWLGDALAARGDARGATHAYETALACAPSSDAALCARRGLLALGARGPASGAAALAHLRRLVAEAQRPADVLALARALGPRAGAPSAASVEEARPYFQLAVAVGAQLSAEDRAFLAALPARPRASDEAYPFALDEADVRALIGEPEEEPLAAILEACWEAAPMLAPQPRDALARAGLADAERLSPVSRVAIAAMYPQVARALGGPSTFVYVARDPAAPDVTVLCASPPVVVFGATLAARPYQSHADSGIAADAELRFRVGQAVELTRPRRILAAGVQAEEFARFVAVVRATFGRPGGDAPAVPEAEAERLRRALPVRIRSRLDEQLRDAPAGSLDPARYLAACARAADRAGLVACPDVNLAIRLAGGAAVARHLVRAAVLERGLALRRRS